MGGYLPILPFEIFFMLSPPAIEGGDNFISQDLNVSTLKRDSRHNYKTICLKIQVVYFKMTGKRVFLMAPIHHHFEKKGWAEPQIVIRFWIISLILAMVGLATLKVR